MTIAASPAQAVFTTSYFPFAALQAETAHQRSPLRRAITSAYRRAEAEAVQWLLAQGARPLPAARALAEQLVGAVRARRSRASGVDALMHEFSLSSDEGVALMCLAEALLRIPDSETADRLIADKISRGDWRSHLGESPSLFVNAATWGLVITGKLVTTSSETGLGSSLSRLIARGGEPLIRKGVDLAMRMLGNQFVTGQHIGEALKNSREREARGYRYSYDMLGEAALTEADAARYFAAYEAAIHAIGAAAAGRGIRNGPGISVKLSALHPRYSRAQRERVLRELLPRLRQLVLLAKGYGIGLNIDAEEADRLELSLDLMEALAVDPALAGYDGIGFVAQAYQKRCPFVIDYLADLARRSGRKFMVRLVKGAYWDAEIKRAQVDGMPGYPVYTRKAHTDVSYLTCARQLLGLTDVLYPQFATHNAHTVAVIHTWAQADGIEDYEFQCLHGMGETLYDQVVGADQLNKPCRIYAPVGSHESLLAYLVRRLLENGANSSFVNQIVDDSIPVAALVADPFIAVAAQGGTPHPAIPLPRALFGDGRANSAGIDLTDDDRLQALAERLGAPRHYLCGPLLDGPVAAAAALPIRNPALHLDLVGQVQEASDADVATALSAAARAAPGWEKTDAADRATLLLRTADLFEEHVEELMALAIREAGKSLPNAIAEVREAVDFLRYYAGKIPADGQALGPIVCISPWNFPLAIFTGQVAAALAAGNVVLAKPAEQTPLIAHRAVSLFLQAGIPAGALQLLPGRGETVGAALTADARVKGVIFTGSSEVAQLINRTLARRSVEEGHEIALIAETGGQNALIVDSSALPEQVVQDVLVSAFDSAGQRCSALRVLCLQEDIAERTLTMLRGALRELTLGVPDRLSTDIGPVIDAEAQRNLQAHIARMRERPGKRVHFALDLPAELAGQGTFVAPTVLEIASLAELTREVFGPVLHVLRYRRADLPQLIADINATGFGLTLGIHSRIDETIDTIVRSAHVGNIYVNRNIVGAVVGVQPFGGEGKSGTGPKAGGPLYLHRLRQASTAAPEHPPRTNPALAALMVWATANGFDQLLSLAGQYARTTLLGTELVLPGPTGERNTLRFDARGTVLCAAQSAEALLNQLAAVLATGNRAVLLRAALDLLPADLPGEVRDRLQFVASLDDCSRGLQTALLEGEQVAPLTLALAERDGVVTAAIQTAARAPIPIWRLVAERAVCVNTTAAGGNASLMTLGL